MAIFAWNQTYSVHVRRFDAQHQKLFEIINNLAEAMQARQGEDVLQEVVGQLAVYTRTHFLQEEVLMKQTGYPQLPAHQAQHSQLMARVEKHKRDLEEGRQPNMAEVLAFLREWLVEHIQRSDKAYSDHMNACGIQ